MSAIATEESDRGSDHETNHLAKIQTPPHAPCRSHADAADNLVKHNEGKMNLDIEALGFTKEELQQRVIDKIAGDLLNTLEIDPDEGELDWRETKLLTQLREVVKQRTDAAVQAIADKYIIPNATQYLENLCLQETNKWGEKTNSKLTFIEYLVKRAEAYLTEEVSYEGKVKGQDGYGSWRASGTRISYLIHQHLQYSIETAMKTALSEANKTIVGGLEQAVKIKLGEIAAQLKVEVKTK